MARPLETTQMKIAEFRRIADEELRVRGLQRHKLPGCPSPVYAAEVGECVRYFGPHATRRPWGCVMLGTFGVEVPAMQAWLSSHDSRLQARLSYYMTNEHQFMSPVAVGNEADLPALGRWLDALCSRVIGLPNDIGSLAALANERAGHLRLLHDSVPEFWPSFELWRNCGTSSLANQ